LKLLTYESDRRDRGGAHLQPAGGESEESRNSGLPLQRLRDAAFRAVRAAAHRLHREAARFMDWLEERCREAGGEHPHADRLRDRRPADLTEIILDHLKGYRGSRRCAKVGNNATSQLQLDISTAS